MREARGAPVAHAVAPLGLARADDRDPGLHADLGRVTARRGGLRGDAVANHGKLVRAAEHEPSVTVLADAAHDGGARYGPRADPKRDRLLYGQRIDAGARNAIELTLEVDLLPCPELLEQLTSLL